MHQFTPERIEGMGDLVIQIVNELLDAQRNRGQLDIVDDFAHPLPVRLFQKMLGVPVQDKARFEVWVTVLVRTVEPPQNVSEAEVEERGSQAVVEMREYLRGLVAARRDRSEDDLISALVVSTSQDDAGQMNDEELLASLQLLVTAGYETTVNSISNGMLTLLRLPDVLARWSATGIYYPHYY
jgi:cytochrome P450